MRAGPVRIGAAALLGGALLLLGGANVYSLPAMFVGQIAVVTAVGALRRDLDGVVLRLGIALIAAGVVLLVDLLSGDVLLTAAAIAACVLLGLAWHHARVLRYERRMAWGIGARDRMQRQARLLDRADALRNRPVRPDGQRGTADSPGQPDV